MLNQIVGGLLAGSAYALVGVSVVLTYRIGGVVNFAQTVVGALCVFLLSSALANGVPVSAAVPMCLALGCLISAFQGWIMARYFGNVSVAVRTAVTIGMALSVYELINTFFGDTPRSFPRLIDGVAFTVGDVNIQNQALLSIVLALVAATTIGLMLSRTRLGVILRAIAVDARTAAGLGVPVQTLVVVVWALNGLLATLAVLLIAPSRGSQMALTLLVAPALAAAVLGRLVNLPLTVVGGFCVGALESLTLEFHGAISYWGGSVVPFAFLTALLIWMQRKDVHGDVR